MLKLLKTLMFFPAKNQYPIYLDSRGKFLIQHTTFTLHTIIGFHLQNLVCNEIPEVPLYCPLTLSNSSKGRPQMTSCYFKHFLTHPCPLCNVLRCINFYAWSLVPDDGKWNPTPLSLPLPNHMTPLRYGPLPSHMLTHNIKVSHEIPSSADCLTSLSVPSTSSLLGSCYRSAPWGGQGKDVCFLESRWPPSTTSPRFGQPPTS